jgi:hypothetical protein
MKVKVINYQIKTEKRKIKMRNSSSTGEGIVSCGCSIILIVLNLLLGGWSVNFLLQFFMDKTISFFGATVIGLFAGEFSIPIAIVISLLQKFGVL